MKNVIQSLLIPFKKKNVSIQEIKIDFIENKIFVDGKLVELLDETLKQSALPVLKTVIDFDDFHALVITEKTVTAFYVKDDKKIKKEVE